MNTFEKEYQQTLKSVLRTRRQVKGRNGIIRQATGVTIKADLGKGFPIITGRKAFFKNIKHEAAWMLSGDTNVKYLNDNGVSIWNQWADDNGDLGPVYGHQFRNFNGIDQIDNLINSLKNHRYSRRHLVNLWNVTQLSEMALPPCHFAFEVVAYPDRFDLVVFMRSLDLFIGLPYDMGVYALYLTAIANEFNVKPGSVVIMAGNAHVYETHVNLASTYVMADIFDSPKLKTSNFTLSNFDVSNIELVGYKSNKAVKVLPIK